MLFCLLFLGGCAKLGPDFQTPEATVPGDWSSDNTNLFKKPSKDDSIAWWKYFKDPVLEELIQAGHEQNLSLLSAGIRIMESRAQLALVRGNRYPQVQKMTGDISTIGTTSPSSNRYYNAASIGFDVGWELDFWGKFSRSIESADAQLLATIAEYDDLLVSLTAEIARTYVDIRTLEERISLAQKNAALQEDSLELVILQFEAGVVSELDVLQARTLLSSTLATVPNLQAVLATYKNGLAILLGILPDDIYRYLLPGKGIPAIASKISMEIPAELLRRRPDIRQAEMQAAAQSAQIGIARSELFPSFTLFGSISWSSADREGSSLGDIFDSNNFAYSFGPAFKWNLFHYGRLENQVRIQDARFQQLLVNYRSTVLNAAREVEDALQSYEQAKIEADLVQRAVIGSKKSTELSILMYKEGLSDYQRVLDSTRSLTQKQDQYAQTKGKIATFAIALYKAFGGGWQIIEGEPFIPQEMKEAMEERTEWGDILNDTSLGEEKP